jgi:hypothetical protein
MNWLPQKFSLWKIKKVKIFFLGWSLRFALHLPTSFHLLGKSLEKEKRENIFWMKKTGLTRLLAGIHCYATNWIPGFTEMMSARLNSVF